MDGQKRPDFIRHYTELQSPDPWPSPDPDSPEQFSFGAPLGTSLGLKRHGIHHELLPPGRRTSPPHAHSHDEEFVFVIAGHPEVWVDGHLYPLEPGDAVAFPAGSGIAHTFINNTQHDVRLLVVGDANQPEDRSVYPLNPELHAVHSKWWENAPKRPLGSHDGRPDRPS